MEALLAPCNEFQSSKIPPDGGNIGAKEPEVKSSNRSCGCFH